MKGKFISGPAALLLLFLFFMPWVTVSCNDVPLGQFSGFDLALGSKTAVLAEQTPFVSAGAISSFTSLFLIPLVALIVLFLFMLTNSTYAKQAAWGQIIAGLVGIFVLLFRWLQLGNNNDLFFEVTVEPSLWGTVLGLILILIGSGLEITQFQETAVAPQASRPPQKAPQHHASRSQSTPPESNRLPNISPKQIQDAPTLPDAPLEKIHKTAQPASATPPQSQPIPPTVMEQDVPPTMLETDSTDNAAQSATQKTVVESLPSNMQPRKTEVLSSELAQIGWLMIRSGVKTGQRFSLKDGMTIGRAETCDMTLSETAVSNHHAQVYLRNGRFLLIDQNSTNGIQVYRPAHDSWEPIKQLDLENNSKIKIGRTLLQVIIVNDD